MSSSSKLKNPNILVSEQEDILNAFINPKSKQIMHFIFNNESSKIDQIVNELNISQEEIEKILVFLIDLRLVYQTNDLFFLTPFANKKISYGNISLKFLEGKIINTDPKLVPHALANSYKIKKCIGNGATSYTFLAEQSGTFKNRTLKIFLPDLATYDQLSNALKKLSEIQGNAAIPEIIEVGQIRIELSKGRSKIVPCVVLKYIEGITFSEFIKVQENITKKIIEHFIIRVGGALAAIEKVGLIHGDLHENNLLVETDGSSSKAKDFWVIDFIGISSSNSPELDIPTDLENFKNHLIRATIIAIEKYPGVSARLLIGDSAFRILEKLRKGVYKSFSDMLDDFYRDPNDIPIDYFRQLAPKPFEWLRVEQIDSSDWLYKLFEPVPSRFEKIAKFSNTWISGPRGCGKSHYLRVLEFHPESIIKAYSDKELADKLDELNLDYKKTFGVLFACRLGEFKGFCPEAIGGNEFDYNTKTFLKHILILKIWNKTLNTIKQGLESLIPPRNKSVIEIPTNINEICAFLEEKLGKIAVVNTNPTEIFQQCILMCSSKENAAISVWNYPSRRPNIRLLDERDLDEFFEAIKRTFLELSQTRFFILVDDASHGHINFEMQKIFNSLVNATYTNHCFKITYEKMLYTLDTTDGSALDPYNEGTYEDLGEISTKAQRETAIDLSDYIAKVINKRLKENGFTADIQTILGKSQNVQDFFSSLSQQKREESQKKSPRQKAYYAGWNIVWSISHGSIRLLLELIEHIFSTNKVTQKTMNIPLKDQDFAVRNFSRRKFKALAMLPGDIDGENIGKKLQAVISAIGEMSRQYLENYETGDENRWYETISVERLDLSKLNLNAQKILYELLRYDLILDEGITFSRAQFGLSTRYDMNKIFAPTFQTTYRVRNHIYISRRGFEDLLLHPDIFVKHHKKKLWKHTDLVLKKGYQSTLQEKVIDDDS